MVRSLSSGLKVAARLSPPLSMKTMSASGSAQHAVDRLQVDRRVLADGGVRAAAGLHAHDALGRPARRHGQQALVFLGVDVVGDDEVPALAHGLAQHLHQRGLAGADRAADAHAQRRQGLGAAGDAVGRVVGRRDQDRNSREYWVSCRADRMASMGAKAWRSSSWQASAASTAAGSPGPAAPAGAGRRSGPAARP
jgi:hypothetical protein